VLWARSSAMPGPDRSHFGLGDCLVPQIHLVLRIGRPHSSCPAANCLSAVSQPVWLPGAKLEGMLVLQRLRKASRPAAGWPVGRASGGCRGSRQSPRRSLEDFSCITEACEVGSVVFEPPLADDIRSLRDGAVPTPPHLGIPSPSLASAPPPQLPPQPSPTVTRRVAGPGR
jgi:hypothetical protein